MRDDLLDAKAAIDWTESQLPAFDGRLSAWLDQNIEIVIKDTPPPATHDVVVAREKALLPLVFSVEAGAYINTIRSSLDILACVIGKREMVLDPGSIYFPVADSADHFARGDYKGFEFVRQLSADSRNIIENFKPYCRGNDTLWALHKLDIMRKHKRLLDTYVRPARSWVQGFGLREIWAPIGTGFMDAGNGESAIGLLLKGAECPKINYTASVCFSETIPTMSSASVTKAITRFAAMARTFIAAFDG
jgi:hypothetical protein